MAQCQPLWLSLTGGLVPDGEVARVVAGRRAHFVETAVSQRDVDLLEQRVGVG